MIDDIKKKKKKEDEEETGEKPEASVDKNETSTNDSPQEEPPKEEPKEEEKVVDETPPEETESSEESEDKHDCSEFIAKLQSDLERLQKTVVEQQEKMKGMESEKESSEIAAMHGLDHNLGSMLRGSREEKIQQAQLLKKHIGSSNRTVDPVRADEGTGHYDFEGMAKQIRSER